MNYDVSKNNLAVKDLVFEGCKEVPVDLDFSLPDYCPDIQKILKCKVSPNISSRNISGDRLNIEGVSKVRVIYLDSENGKIRCCENSVPFSCSLDMRCSPEGAIAVTNTKAQYVNCRAVSPRKLDIHGSFSVCAKVYDKKNLNISENICGKDIQQKISDMRVNNLIAMGQQQFSLSESIEMQDEKPPAEMIINSDVKVILDDYKNMPNKTVVKGEAIVRILYIDDISSGNTEVLEYKIPVSQIVDVPGIDENSKCTVNATVLGHDEQVSSENGIISCEIKLLATVTAYDEKDISVVSDVYSTDYDVDVARETIKIDKLIDVFKENVSYKDSIKLSDTNISKIVDVWVDNPSVQSDVSDGNLVFKSKVSVCILAFDSEETPIYIERILEFSHTKSYENSLGSVECESVITPLAVSFSISSQDTIDINMQFEILGELYSCRKCNMAVQVTSDESRLIPKDSASLAVYYASKGESVWDIARKYYTCVNMIKEENDLSEDEIRSGGMILIPMK